MNGEALTFNQIFSRNLKTLLAYNGKQQKELAEYIDASTSTVSDWCKGTKTPRANKIDKICEFLKCTRTDLMEDKVLTMSEFRNRTAKRELEMVIDTLNENEVNAVLGFIKTMRSYANESN